MSGRYGYVIKIRGWDDHVVNYYRNRDEAYWDVCAMNERYQTNEYYYEEYDGARGWFEGIKKAIDKIREQDRGPT